VPSGFAEAASRKGPGPAVLILLIALWPGCGRQEGCSDPKEVLNLFFTGIEAGDLEAAYGLLDAESRKALESIASETTRLTGRSFEPHEFLVPNRFDKKPGIARIQTEKGKGKGLTVVILYEDGSSEPFPLTREGNCYKVHIDI
jgi:hypothetical protein